MQKNGIKQDMPVYVVADVSKWGNMIFSLVSWNCEHLCDMH